MAGNRLQSLVAIQGDCLFAIVDTIVVFVRGVDNYHMAAAVMMS